MPDPAQGRRIGALSVLFLASGAAGLIYQVCWQRLLFAAFGSDLVSVTVIVSAFMAGLGLGALAGGWAADRWPARALALFRRHLLPALRVIHDPRALLRVLIPAVAQRGHQRLAFRGRTRAELADVTIADALAHPTWAMGAKITVDSATLMNKGLEVIEAHWLFGLPANGIEVVIHPQSVIHSMVSYADGSVIAQLGNPDMRTPIAHAMAYPHRIDAGVRALDLFEIARLDFERPDHDRFPCLALAYRALEEGGVAPAVLNAANEVAVGSFLDGALRFDRIPAVIADTLDAITPRAADSLELVFEADRKAREIAGSLVRGLGA